MKTLLSGKELIELLSNNKLKEGTKLNILFCYEPFIERKGWFEAKPLGVIMYDGEHFKCLGGSWKLSYLFNNYVKFEIVKYHPHKLAKIETNKKKNNSLVSTINELVDAINYIFEKMEEERDE